MGERQPASTRAPMPGTNRASRLHLTSQPPPCLVTTATGSLPLLSPPAEQSSTFLLTVVFLCRM